MFVVDSETNIMNTKTNHQITSSKSSLGAPETLNRNADSPASGPRSGLRARLRSLGLGLLGAVLLLPLPGARAFTLIDSGTQMPAFCSAAGQAADIITNPNDRWWWGMPPNPPGPVVIRYRYTAAFDTAFANTTAHPNLNSAIKQQIDLAFQTWERAGTTPRTGASHFRRNGVQPFGDIRSICLHEIGHLMGLHHPNFGAASTRNFCPSGGGFVTCAASGNEVMNSSIGAGNYNHILSFDELDAFNRSYAGQTIDFQRVGAAGPAEIDIDTRTAGAGNWALATLCGIQRNGTDPLQGRQMMQGKIQFNVAASNPLGFRTLAINWDYQCNSIETREFRIRTRGTDNPMLFARYDGPASGSPYIFTAYANNAVPGFKDDRLHAWSNPNAPIAPGELIHVGIEQDVWDWSVISAIALDSIGTPCTASLVSSHEYNNEFNISAAAASAPAPDDSELRLAPPPVVRARGIVLKVSDSPINRLSNLMFADVSGMNLKLADLNRALLTKLQRAGRVEKIPQFEQRQLPANGNFIVTFQGNVEDLPEKIRASGNFLILQRPQYLDRELLVFVESANNESVAGSYALMGTAPLANVPQPQQGPPLDIKLLKDRRVQICWPEPPTGYVLQSTPQLVPARWTTVADQGKPANGSRCVILPASEKQMFFRLVNPQPVDGCTALPGQECFD